MVPSALRRRIFRGALALGATFAVLGLRQFGVIRRLPDLPFRGFDANAVMRSPAAYPLGIPDSVFAVAGCATIAGLAKVRADRALFATTLGGVAVATYYLHNMAFVQRRVCIYCVASAGGFFALAYGAARLALRRPD